MVWPVTVAHAPNPPHRCRPQRTAPLLSDGNTHLTTLQAMTVTDLHYEWELENANGEWQAGGSCNSFCEAVSEGNRYLMQYAQDGPHKLVVKQHETLIVHEQVSA